MASLLPGRWAAAEGEPDTGKEDADNKAPVDVDTLSQMNLDELLNVDVTVASKVESSAADAPSSVTVFTQDEIRHMGVQTLQELLNYVPGFQTMREVEQGLSDAIGARGRNTALSESVLFLVDGQRLNDLYTGGASLLNRGIAVENIRQVEIIRGPGSALYGANAFLGVVDIKTVHGVSALFLGIGNAGVRTAAASATTKIGEATVDGFVRIAEQKGFDFVDVIDSLGQVGPQKNRSSALDAAASVQYKGFELHLRHMSRQQSGFLIFAALQDVEGNRESTQQSSATLTYKKKICQFDIAASAGYSEDEWRALALFYPPGFELAPGVILDHAFYGGPNLRTRTFDVNLDGQWTPDPALTLAAGLSFERAQATYIADLYNYDPITLDYKGNVLAFPQYPFTSDLPRYEVGAYAQGTYKLKDRLTATAGVRVDYYNDFGASVNPRAALVYKTPVESRVKLMYGRAFRAPNYLEYHDQFNPVDFGNPHLSPETVDSVELAYVQDFGKVFRGTATAFGNWIRDEITFGTDTSMTPDPANPYGAPTFSNSSVQQKNVGLELEVRAQVVPGFDVYGTYSRISGDDTPRFPRNFGALALNYAWGPVNINLSGIARGKIQSLGNQDPYAIVNARVEYAVTKHAAVYINGRNLLDTHYQTPASLIPVGVPNDPLLVLVGLIANQ